MNDLLEDFDQIVERLGEKGVEVDETFGSSAKTKGTPTQFVVSVGPLMDPSTVAKVFRALDANSIDGVSLVREDYAQDRVYIGSYIYETRPEDVKPLTKAKFARLASDELTKTELINLIK